MTKGGVMIGSTVRTRRARLKRKSVRVAISAKARPSAVVPMPTSVARNRVFQATPQRRFEVRQSRLQIEGSRNFAKNAPGAKAPASSRTALARIVVTGKNTKTAISATTRPIDETTKASPRHQPRAASPWQSSIRNDDEGQGGAETHAGLPRAGRPEEGGQPGGVPAVEADREALQRHEREPGRPRRGEPARRRSRDRTRRTTAASRRGAGSSDRQQPPRRPGKPQRQRAPGRPERITGQACRRDTRAAMRKRSSRAPATRSRRVS